MLVDHLPRLVAVAVLMSCSVSSVLGQICGRPDLSTSSRSTKTVFIGSETNGILPAISSSLDRNNEKDENLRLKALVQLQQKKIELLEARLKDLEQVQAKK